MTMKLQSLDFDGTDDFLDCGNGAAVQVTDKLTFGIWWESGAQADYEHMVKKWESVGDDRGWMMRTAHVSYPGCERRLHIVVSDDGVGTNQKDWVSDIVNPASGYVFNVLTWDSGTLKAYAQGTVVPSWTKTRDDAFTTINNSTSPLEIMGSSPLKAKFIGAFLLDTEVASQADVTALFNGGTPKDPRSITWSGNQVLKALIGFGKAYPKLPGADDVPDKVGTNHGTTQGSMTQDDVADTAYDAPNQVGRLDKYNDAVTLSTWNGIAPSTWNGA